jgi:hypothetical protein
MRFILLAAILLASGAIAGEAPPSAPPAKPAPAAPPPCINARDTADYVPGADVYGRPVAPADLPGTAQVQISPEVYPILKSRNPQLNGVGVVATLPGPANQAICPAGRPPGGAFPRR